ncbi:MAG: alpha/beta fold hydrolase [Actinomycetia bacterium]|nr:alpha/beta fold hydrolase [Actinomycetes bacterium]MCP4087138.1 alpha/beta fold hydrolase [Actinomycetes bacterium]
MADKPGSENKPPSFLDLMGGDFAKLVSNPFGFVADGFAKATKRNWNLTRHMLGIDRAETGQSERDTVWSSGKSVLYRYRNDNVTVREPILLVMSLVSRSFILDLQPGNSFVEHLCDQGFDVFLLDWGVPDAAEADNDLAAYTDHLVPAAVAEVNRTTGGHGVNVFGYCFGGLLALLYAAGHPDDPINSLLVMATPADFEGMPKSMSGLGMDGIDPRNILNADGNVPASAVRASFSMLTPTADLTTVADFWEHLDDDKFLNSYQAMTSWTRDHIPFPGAAMIETTEVFQERNGFINDDLPIGGRRRHLADIKVPFLNVIAERDHIVPPDSSRALVELIGSDDKTQIELPAGHVGLIVGGGGRKRCMPAMSDWMRSKSTQLTST